MTHLRLHVIATVLLNSNVKLELLTQLSKLVELLIMFAIITTK